MLSARKRKRTFFQSSTAVEEDEIVTRVEVIRSANRGIRKTSTKVSIPVDDAPSTQPWPSQTPEQPPSAYEPALDNPSDPVPKKTRKGLSRSIANNLEHWHQYEKEFADELMMHEGLPYPTPPPCDTCHVDGATYRCLDCYFHGLSCKTCIIRQHTRHPLHAIQQWNGVFFTRKTLFDLGLSYQLGHDVDDSCPLPSTPVNLTLFDISGVHTVRVRYCFCSSGGSRPSVSRRVQLLRVRLFPASWSRPGTAFTFRLLDFTHKLQTRSKVNLYDFHASLVSVTDSAGLAPPPSRYSELALVLRIWVYLRQVRRGGGVHIPGGLSALAPGSLAVELSGL